MSVEPRMPTRPAARLMDGAWDTHCHVFGPFDRFPFVEPPAYPPLNAAAEKHRAMLKTVGATRGVLVQPAPYGTNADAIADAIHASGGRLRGVAAATSADSFERLHGAGMRGLRFVDMRDPSGKPYAGSVSADELPRLAPRMKDFGWHAVLWAPIDRHVETIATYARLGIPLVLDHMAMLGAVRSVGDAAFQTVLRAVGDGQVYVKLTLCRVSKDYPDYTELRPFHDALVKANPDRLLWGSDWPFVRLGDASPDVGRLVDLFHAWVGDEETRKKILIDNPERLYGA
jgi:predicted TIM-barrel fold metal-dependent hydrolase